MFHGTWASVGVARADGKLGASCIIDPEENGMRVVLYGATGMIGSRILKELLSRGHTVTAVVRDPSKLAPQNNLTIEKGDMLDADSIAKIAKGSDVVISSYGPPSGPQGPDPAKVSQLVEATRALIAGVRRAGAPASSWWAAPAAWKFRRDCRLSTRRRFPKPTSRWRWRTAMHSTSYVKAI